MNYYNEFDPKAAAWLRELIAAGLIPAGDVDERSILDVRPNELVRYTQCHFFAGIGGWPRALHLAGWPDNRPVWTGSCPCQPFSCAGKGKGTDDERHLWPVFAELIRACKPPTVFGEQVASKAGREWLAGVFADLEGMGYQRAGADLCAASLGAPHIRQRLYWVADAEQPDVLVGSQNEREAQPTRRASPCRLADSIEPGLEGLPGDGDHGHEPGRVGTDTAGSVAQGRAVGGLGDSDNAGRETLRSLPLGSKSWPGKLAYSSPSNFWSSAILIPCRDGKARRVEPSIFPLAHGIPGRVGLLRGAGNAIVPQVAATFISAYLDVTSQNPPLS